MRRLATLCFPALLCAISAPALAANDGVITFVPPETQLSQYASGAAPASVPAPAPTRGRYGGGFIEALLTGGALQQPQRAAPNASEPADVEAEPELQFRRQEVDYSGTEAPGTIVVDTPDRFLFLVEPHGKALRYGIGVGRPGFEWAGVKRISRKSEWPDWTPPAQMLLRRPDLPRLLALPHSRHQRAVDHRPQRLVRLHPDDERGCDRPLRSRARRDDGCGALKRKRRGA
jgi:lipoprotein-anchoring transpeptidase ErfK/SrfK